MSHLCHAHGCNAPVPPRMFCCKSHWYALRKPLRDAIWREYRPGQERDKQASDSYLAVQRLALAELAFKPNDEEAARVCAGYLAAAISHRERAIAAGRPDPLLRLLPED